MFLRPFAERSNYRWFVVQLPLIWVAIDLVVQNNEIFGTYMWIAYRLAPVPELVQPVSITGTPALSLLIHVVNAAIALAVIALIDRDPARPDDVPVPRRVLRWSVAIPVAAVRDLGRRQPGDLPRRDQPDGPRRAGRRGATGSGQRHTGHADLRRERHPRAHRGPAHRRPDRPAERDDPRGRRQGRQSRCLAGGNAQLRPAGQPTPTGSPPWSARPGCTWRWASPPTPPTARHPTPACCGARRATWQLVYYKTKRVIVEGEKFTPGTRVPDGEHTAGCAGHDHLLRHRLPRRPGPPGGAQRGADDPGAEHRLRVGRRRARRLNGVPRHRESRRHGQGRRRVGLGDRRAQRPGGGQHRRARRARRAGPAGGRRSAGSARCAVHPVRGSAVPVADLRRGPAADRRHGGVLAAAARGQEARSRQQQDDPAD